MREKKVRIYQKSKLLLKSETKNNLYTHPTLSFLFVSLSSWCWAWCHMIWGIPFTSLGQLSWLCPLPGSGSPRAYWPLWRSVPALLSSTQNVDVLSTSFQQKFQSTALWELLWGKLTPSQTDPIHSGFVYSFLQILFLTAFLLFLFESRKLEKSTLSERVKMYVYFLFWENLPVGNRTHFFSEISIVLNHYMSKTKLQGVGKGDRRTNRSAVCIQDVLQISWIL